MILGDNECDWETAFFMTYGRQPTLEEISKHHEHLLKEYLKKQGLSLKEWQKQIQETEKDYHIHDDAPDAYYCWQGTRIPQWFE